MNNKNKYKEIEIGLKLKLKIENNDEIIIYKNIYNEDKKIISIKDGVIYIHIVHELYEYKEYNIIIKYIYDLDDEMYKNSNKFKIDYSEFKNILKEICLNNNIYKKKGE